MTLATTETHKPKGRPRKSGPRTPNGQLERKVGRDRGTHQLERRRRWLAQGGDESKTEYPLGVMLINSLIPERSHKAGCRYAFLHFIVFGRKSYSALNWDGVELGRGADPDDVWLARMEADLRGADKAFTSRKEQDLVISACVYERIPRCLLPKIPTISEINEAEQLVFALKQLASHWHM